MPRKKLAFPTGWTLADLLRHLGGIAADRVRLDPPPGLATPADVDYFDAHEDRLYELIDGVLVEKVYNLRDSLVATTIGVALGSWDEPLNAGIVTGASAAFRFGPNQVRMPDAAFTSWDRLPGGKIPREPVPAIVPDLAVEVINRANTVDEMGRKLRDYAKAGVRLVWYVDPERKEVTVYPRGKERGKRVVGVDGTLDGGDVLPGFALPVAKIFAKRAPAKKAGKKGKK